jgi:hypothetical protein
LGELCGETPRLYSESDNWGQEPGNMLILYGPYCTKTQVGQRFVSKY